MTLHQLLPPVPLPVEWTMHMLLQVDPIKAAGDVEHLGIVGILALVIIGGALAFAREWVVTGSQHKATVEQYEERLKDAIEQRDRLLNLALRQADTNKEALQEVKRGNVAPRGGSRREA